MSFRVSFTHMYYVQNLFRVSHTCTMYQTSLGKHWCKEEVPGLLGFHTHVQCTQPVCVSTDAKRFPHKYCYEFFGNGTRYVLGGGFHTHVLS